MSDETNDPTPDTPSEATPPVTPAPPAAEVPTEPAVPAATAPTPAPAPAPAPPPAPEAAPVTEPIAAAAPVAPAPAVAAPVTTKQRKHVAIPVSVLVALAALIGAAVMFGIGYAVGDNGNSDSSAARVQLPNNPFNQQGNGNGSGTQQLPNNPFNPQGNGSGTQQTPSQTTSGAFLGVASQQASNGSGVEITQVVPGSAADNAGLQQGDVITSFDGTKITTPAGLGAAVASTSPGDKVQVTYTRDGQTKTVTVTLGTRTTNN